ncbi:unnamed protein product [Schistocephalus solidus]|uniref:Chorionic gonadotropin beta subunit 1 n=1 Tax=Schistocephalus solidus TaxID=70667 RepID=A0A183T640_SCHSO|nr:unnamed protein product [Schistocephalus solidus]
MLRWPPLTCTQLSPVAPHGWALPSGYTPGNRHDRRAKPGAGLQCCVCLHTRTPSPADQHLLPPSEAGEGHVNAPSVVPLAVAGLRSRLESTALEVLGRARRQHQDSFDDHDSNISNLLVDKNGLHKAYMDLRTDATKAAFFRCLCFVQHQLREMQDA